MSGPLLSMVPELAAHAELVEALPLQDSGGVLLALCRAAEGFLLAGGQWSAADWLDMGDLERAAAEQAGQRVWQMRTSAVLDAQGHTEGAARLMAPIDGGEALESYALDVVAARVMAADRLRVGVVEALGPATEART